MKKITMMTMMTLLACMFTLFAAQAAMAVDTGATAYVNFTNQAHATYKDVVNTALTADSNIVTVRMLRVYGVTVATGDSGQCEPTGSNIVYTYTITNTGNMDDTFDLTKTNGGVLSKASVSLAPLGHEDVTLTVTVSGTTTDGVSAASTGGTLNTPVTFVAHPSDSASLQTSVCEGDLSGSTKTMTNGDTHYEAGDIASFKIHVVNGGTYAATNVVVFDALPTATLEAPFTAQIGGVDVGTWGAGAQSNELTYNAGTMAPTDNFDLIVTGKVKGGLTDFTTTIDNSAHITYDHGGPHDPTPPSPPKVYAPNLTVVKYQGTASNYSDASTSATALDANPGDTIYYRVVVTNTGHAKASTVTISDLISTYLDTPTVTDDGGVTVNAHFNGTNVVTDAVDLDDVDHVSGTFDTFTFDYNAKIKK